MYVGLNFATSGYVLVSLYEGWNASTHAATNQADTSALNVSYNQRTNLTSGGNFYLSASSAHMGFASYQSSTWGASVGSCPSIATQRSRRSAYDTIANAYPPTVLMFNNWNASPRISNLTGSADITGSSARVDMYAGPWLYSALSPIASAAIATSDKSVRHLLLPLSFSTPSAAFFGGECSSLNDIWMTTYNYGGGGDEVTVGSSTYVIWPYNTGYRLAVRKG